jgi:hypothetical protein
MCLGPRLGSLPSVGWLSLRPLYGFVFVPGTQTQSMLAYSWIQPYPHSHVNSLSGPLHWPDSGCLHITKGNIFSDCSILRMSFKRHISIIRKCEKI